MVSFTIKKKIAELFLKFLNDVAIREDKKYLIKKLIYTWNFLSRVLK